MRASAEGLCTHPLLQLGLSFLSSSASGFALLQRGSIPSPIPEKAYENCFRIFAHASSIT